MTEKVVKPSSYGISQRANDSIDDFVRELTHLCVGPVLNRMAHKTTTRRIEAECLGLRNGRVLEFTRNNRHGRNAVDLEMHRVMQTARGTGASVGERLDDEVALRLDRLTERLGGRLRECRLRVALNFDPGRP